MDIAKIKGLDDRLSNLREHAKLCQVALSFAFDEAPDGDLAALEIDEAGRDLNSALTAIDNARENLAIVAGRSALDR